MPPAPPVSFSIKLISKVVLVLFTLDCQSVSPCTVPISNSTCTAPCRGGCGHVRQGRSGLPYKAPSKVMVAFSLESK